MKTAIEVEYWVVDDDGYLTTSGSLTDRSEYVEPEFVEPLLEIKTSPCGSMDELRLELLGRIQRVVDDARDEGKRLVPLGTPLCSDAADVPSRECDRTDLQRLIVGPAFGDARYCAGTHVHFDRSNEVDQLNALTALDPAFALVNTASHHHGEPYPTCARPYLYRRCCYDQCPTQGQLWPYVDSVAEWEHRLEDAYETFRVRAHQRGIDLDRVDDEFDPHTAVWTPVRLREAMPTVEWRSPDTAIPSQIFTLVEGVRSFVERADTLGTSIPPDSSSGPGQKRRPRTGGTVPLPSFETVEQVTTAAMHDGVANPRVDGYLRWLGFDPAGYDRPAERFSDERLTKRRARQLRLDAARRLEADLERSVAAV